jgi:thiol:disulfide interchange protein
MLLIVVMIFGINVDFDFTIDFVTALGVAIMIDIVFIISIVIGAVVVTALVVVAMAYLGIVCPSSLGSAPQFRRALSRGAVSILDLG